MSQDALSYKYGRGRTARTATYKFLQAIGPVGGTHYLVRWLGGEDETAERVVPLSTLEDYAFFPMRRMRETYVAPEAKVGP